MVSSPKKTPRNEMSEFMKCRNKLVTPDITFKWIPYRWSAHESDNSYTFRGDIDLRHLVHDCIKDNQFGFIAIGPEYTHVGIIAGALTLPLPPVLGSTAWRNTIDGFMIYGLKKSDTPNVVKSIPKIINAYRKRLQKNSRKIKKRRGKLGNSPRTKVMTY